MGRDARPATLREVAEAVGCSVATVSRVLAGDRPVGPDLARRVQEAARELGYMPNQVARALRSRSTRTVGLVLPQITNPFFPELMRAVEHALHDQGRALLLADSADDPVLEAERVELLIARQVDGLIVAPVDQERSVPTLAKAAARVPVVLLDRSVDAVQADAVTVDNAAGIRLLLDHLRSQGRRRLWFLGPAGEVSAGLERRAAFQEWAARYADLWRVELGDFSIDFGEHAAGKAVTAPATLRPDALVCANDLIAAGALRRLRELGVEVPGQVAVTGFDDIALASLTSPALTTVRQPNRELAAEAARMLLARIQQPQASARAVRLTPALVTRGSTVVARENASDGSREGSRL
ncbi:LacI family DNA-binding transcriptional regulator [Actinospica robiniae]|uniref:LacI family DNA-binding transcriptional regulator n=1 Tax=Actinospica robiniae TaxID=304901 RepID=UPI00055390BC|nr:LacI family DNA-binding transcriptional regulator [Actinospica robiniae]